QNLPQGEVSIGKVNAAMQLQQKGATEPSAPPSPESMSEKLDKPVIASGAKQSLPEKEIASSPMAPRNDMDPTFQARSEPPTSEPAPAALALQGQFDLESFLLSQGPEKQELVSCYHTKGRITAGSRLAPLDLHLADI